MKMFTIALAALVLLPAGAEAKEAAAAVHVSYADLNLRSDAGLRTLDRRLAHAVKTVCGVEDGSTQMTRQLEARRCVTAVAAEVRQQRSRALAEAGTAPAALASLAP
jgi:UrcA family protein